MKKDKEHTTPHSDDPAAAEGGGFLRRLIHGQFMSSDFFARHWLPVLVTVVLIMTYIASKYICQTRMEQINKLTKELEIVKAERVRVRSLYMGRTSESAMQHLVDSVIPGLAVQERPPYKITE